MRPANTLTCLKTTGAELLYPANRTAQKISAAKAIIMIPRLRLMPELFSVMCRKMRLLMKIHLDK
jgi:hypothetical protein